MKADSEKGLFSIVIESISDCINLTNHESEIDKIAKGLCKNPKEELVEKRKLVYEFFRTEIPKIKEKLRFISTLQTVYYIDYDGRRKYFSIGIDCVGYHYVSIFPNGILGIGGSFYTGDELDGPDGLDTPIFLEKDIVKGVLFEYISLLEFDKLVNSRTEDFAFSNMFGRKIEEIARTYNLGLRTHQLDRKAGREFNKVLRRNYLYWKTKSSFQRAQEEFECYERARKECEKVV